MNTPLGVQGLAHQKRRDEHERHFAKIYGLDKADTPAASAKAFGKARQRIDYIKSLQDRASKARQLIAAGGR